jgi:hypothetical protein
MELIRSRNQQTAMPALLNTLFEGELREDMLVVDHPVVFTFERPRERLVFWPGIRRNPAHELHQALQSISTAEASLEKAAAAIVGGADNFLFTTPQMVVQGKMASDGRMNLTAILADTNPFTGAFGQAGLQLSILHELLANIAKKSVGELSIQQMGLVLQKQVVEQLLKGSFDNMPEDPYSKGMKPRKVDPPLDIATLIDPQIEAIGGKSKWARLVAAPLLRVAQAETAEDALELCKKIKADDWRRAMTEWCEAVMVAEKFRAAQEQAAQEKAGDGEA